MVDTVLDGLTPRDLRVTQGRVAPHVLQTPLVPSPGLSEALGVPVWLKLECAQTTGSFKVRGAVAALSARVAAGDRGGVVTCSAGNHGKGMAWAGDVLGVEVAIHVPSTVDPAKLAGMRQLGAEVVVSEHPGYDAVEVEARAASRSRGRAFISAFEHPHVVLGNGGTLFTEIVDQCPDVASIVVPVGGGGLGAGMGLAASWHDRPVAIWGVQHAQAGALRASLDRGEAITAMEAVPTLAGGLEGGLGMANFAVLQARLAGAVGVDEDAIHDAVRWMIAEHQLLVEPSAAATVAACRAGLVTAEEGPVVVLVSGRNVALDTVRTILAQG